jgi:hypothetical protein
MSEYGIEIPFMLYVTEPLTRKTRMRLLNSIESEIYDESSYIYHLISNRRIQPGSIPEGIYQINSYVYLVSARFKVYTLGAIAPEKDDIYMMPFLTTSTILIENGIPVTPYKVNSNIPVEVLEYKLPYLDTSEKSAEEIWKIKQDLLQKAYERENGISEITADNMFTEWYYRYWKSGAKQ